MMNIRDIHGAIAHPDSSRHDDYLFRVSLKAVILNKDGLVLVVKETGRDWWDIPGGGIDHGETIHEALTRELREEVSIKSDFDYEVIVVEDPRYLETHNLYQMRITFLVTPEHYVLASGVDSDEAIFADPKDFKDSNLITERKIYEYSQLAFKRLGTF
jgi:8-oxo-dGTP pyrophosphatase MutT (NUDIX family)